MAKLSKASKPGVFRRHIKGCRGTGRCECPYVIVWRSMGRQFTETHRTMALAVEGRRRRDAEVAEGAFSKVGPETLHEFALDWIERYQGTGKKGYRPETRDEDRRLLERFALQYFPANLKVAEITPRMVDDFIVWLTRQPSRRGGALSDSGVRNAFKPFSVCLASARREGLIRHTPASEAVLPSRPEPEDEEHARPFPDETMELVVSLVSPRHRLMFELLAATGMRRSELLALEGRHLNLAGAKPHVKVRKRLRRRRGVGLVVGPLKSRHSRREIPVSREIADQLAALKTEPEALVFHAETKPLDPDNLYSRALKPATAEAGVGWAGFHTFRHTVASRLFAEGRNAVQVQRWLGHHSPSFTLDTYVHLLDPDLGSPLGGGDQGVA